MAVRPGSTKGLKKASAGDVLVIDSRGSRRALTGGLFPTEAQRRSLAGIVIDGFCRDTATIRKVGIPYYARGRTPFAGTTERLFPTHVEVSCGAVVVHPGDWIFGDDDGLVVANDEQFAELIPLAEQIQASEARLFDQMGKGVSLLEMLNFAEHCVRLAAGKASKLELLV